MTTNKKNSKESVLNNTKKEIIELRIKNDFYDRHSVIDKVIDEMLFEQFMDFDIKAPKSHS